MNSQIIKLIAEIDEFKGFWKGINIFSQETLSRLKIVATIESIGSSTRIEGVALTKKKRLNTSRFFMKVQYIYNINLLS